MIWFIATVTKVKFFASSLQFFAAGLFGFPSWDEYLPRSEIGGQLDSPEITNIKDFWLIAAAFLEMALYAAGLMAVGYFIYSGFIFMTSQGNPERVAIGRKGLINAAVGLIIALSAANIVGLIAGMS